MTTRSFRKNLLTATTILSGLTVGISGALAESQVIEEIVITARKREERLQSVPISITAVTETQLERLGASNFYDFARTVPGLSFNNSLNGRANIALRGIVSTAGAPTTGLYIDEISVTGGGGDDEFSGAADPRIFDISRVEVLRGPQGTLYGAGSMGGTIRFITNQPKLDVTEGSLEGEVATTKSGAVSYKGTVVLNAPVIEEKIAIRAGISYLHEGGYVDRVVGGEVVEKNGDENNDLGIRVSALIKPSENLSITPTVYYQRNKQADDPRFVSTLPGLQKTTKIAEPREDEFMLYGLTANYDAGPVVLTSVTSYFDREVAATAEYTDTDTGVFASIFGGIFGDPTLAVPLLDTLSRATVGATNKRFAQEFRIASNTPDSKLNWIFGAYYSREKTSRSLDVFNPDYNDTLNEIFDNDPPFLLPNDRIYTGDTRVVNKDYALFGDITYDVTQALSLSLGLRWFKNSNAIDSYAGGFFGGFDELTLVEQLKSKEDGFNPKATLNYKLAENSLAYGTVSRGFRSGGPNSSIPTNACITDALADLGISEIPGKYSSDKVWNYEIGSKNTFANGRVMMNGAAFYIDWSSIPQTVPLGNCGYSFTDNVGKAVSKGGEFEFQAEVMDGLRLSANVTYTDATLKADAPTLGGERGDRVQYVPKWMYSLGADYVVPVSDGMNAVFHIDYQYRSSVRRNFIETDRRFHQEGYGTVAMRIGLETETWSLSAFAKNLFNNNPIMNRGTGRPAVSDDNGDPIWKAYDYYTTLRPRTIGLSGKFNF